MASYYRIVKRKALPWIRLGIPPCRCWCRKPCSFYKIFKENKPVYLLNLIPSENSNCNTRNTYKITPFHSKRNFLKNYLFPSTVIKWNKLDPNLSVFKRSLLKFIRPSPNSVFNCHNCKGIKYLTRLHLGLSHLHEHKFKHSFEDTLNLFCSCSLDAEINTHFFIYCPLFTNQRYSSWAKLMTVSGKLPPGKFPPIKLPLENSHLEYSHPCF